MLQYCLQYVCSQQNCYVFGTYFGDVKISQVRGILHHCTCNSLRRQVQPWYFQASSTVIWTPVSGPSTAPTWNDTFLERIGSTDDLIVPSCKGLSSPTRPITSANFSKISEVWLPESSSANVFTLTPLEVATATGTLCNRTAEGAQFTDEDGCCSVQSPDGWRAVQRWWSDENRCRAVD